jgi:hypothetical protein
MNELIKCPQAERRIEAYREKPSPRPGPGRLPPVPLPDRFSAGGCWQPQVAAFAGEVSSCS